MRAIPGYVVQVTGPLNKLNANTILATLDPAEVQNILVLPYGVDCRYIVIYLKRKPVEGLPTIDDGVPED
jgi:hypothetical protein